MRLTAAAQLRAIWRWPHTLTACFNVYISLRLCGVLLWPGRWAGPFSLTETATAAVLLALLFWSIVDLRARGFFPVHTSGAELAPADSLALTFDDGPDPVGTPLVLDALAAAGMHATFFVLGHKVRRHPQLVKEIIAAGHEVALHGETHHWWRHLRPKRVDLDLDRACAGLRQLGCMVRYFRPIYGVAFPALAPSLRRHGLQVVGWSCRARDGGGFGSSEAALRRLEPGLRRGAIVLLHDSPARQASSSAAPRAPHGPQILPQVLAELNRRGLRSVSLTTLLEGAKNANGAPDGVLPGGEGP